MSKRARPRAIRIAAALAILALSAPTAPALAADVGVAITDRLEPADLTIAPGTRVEWRNDDGDRHRIRSRNGPEEFDSGNLEPGEHFVFQFTFEGTYRYHDDRDEDNPAYHGTIVVTSSAEPPGEPPTDPPSDPPSDPPPPGAGDVSIIDRTYRPATIEIAVGGSVSWSNDDDRAHTVTATDRSWDSGIFDTGASYARSFPTAGSFPYFCILHPDMTGTVVVTGGGDPPPDPPEDPQPPDPPEEPPPDPPPPPPPPGGGDVRIVDNAFAPSSLTVGVGATVEWINAGAIPHTVTSAAGGFDSGFLMAGDTFRRSFPTAGTFGYVCTLHPEMTGTVVVTGGGDPPPDPPEDPQPPDPPQDPPDPPVSDAAVGIVDNAYEPATVTVNAGSTVTWVNRGALPHTVTDRANGFDSSFLMAGDTFSFTPGAPGTIEYFCTIHPEMTGTIVVTEGTSSGGDTGGDPPPGIPTSPDPVAGSSPSGLPPDSAASSGDAVLTGVRIVDLDYEPQRVTIEAGTGVRWSNAGALPHTVTARDGSFDSGIMATDAEFTRVFEAAGSFEYWCTLHPDMVGVVEVVAVAVASVPAGPGSLSAPNVWVAIVLASAIFLAIAAFSVAMVRFGRAAEAQR